MSDAQAGSDAAAATSGPLSPRQVRALKAAIVIMAVMIVVGLLAVIGRIVYLGSTRAPQAAVSRVLVGEGALALPAGAVIRSISLDGDRLAVHFESSSGAGLAILDAANGRVTSRWRIETEVPRQ